jgi:hypothetical protein
MIAINNTKRVDKRLLKNRPEKVVIIKAVIINFYLIKIIFLELTKAPACSL